MRLFTFALFLPFYLLSQSYPEELKVDSSYAVIQGYDNVSLLKLQNHFKNVDADKLVFLHYGGSHIQAENPTTIARRLFQERFGNGGRGLMFNYAAADSYNSINYSSTYKGEWIYNKSYQGRKKNLPLGICGMVVETEDSLASLSFLLNQPIPQKKSELTIFFENDSLTFPIKVILNGKLLSKNLEPLQSGLKFEINESIESIEIRMIPSPGKRRFRFYGLNIEHKETGGIVYHSTGVGAAAFRSILILDKLSDQLPAIKPDIVLLDFGTNDILYHNRIEPTLVSEIEKSIKLWRDLCPEILIVLTSTQDLFYKKHSITAAIDFRNLVDSLARSNHCLFWNWYDLSGGLNTIRDWSSQGFAKTDYVHLTKEGYKIKGTMLYKSFMNTLAKLQSDSTMNELTIPLKTYELQIPIPSNDEPPLKPKPKPKPKLKVYVVKSGDTLSAIARKYHTTVVKLKKANNLKTDIINVGQKLRLP